MIETHTKNITYNNISFTISLTKNYINSDIHVYIVDSNINLAICYFTYSYLKVISIDLLSNSCSANIVKKICNNIRIVEMGDYSIILNYGGLLNISNLNKYDNVCMYSFIKKQRTVLHKNE